MVNAEIVHRLERDVKLYIPLHALGMLQDRVDFLQHRRGLGRAADRVPGRGAEHRRRDRGQAVCGQITNTAGDVVSEFALKTNVLLDEVKAAGVSR